MKRLCLGLVISILVATDPVYAVSRSGVGSPVNLSAAWEQKWLTGSSKESVEPPSDLSDIERQEWLIGIVVGQGELCGYYSQAAGVRSFMTRSPHFKKALSLMGRFDFATGCGKYESVLDRILGRKNDWEAYLKTTYPM